MFKSDKYYSLGAHQCFCFQLPIEKSWIEFSDYCIKSDWIIRDLFQTCQKTQNIFNPFCQNLMNLVPTAQHKTNKYVQFTCGLQLSNTYII